MHDLLTVPFGEGSSVILTTRATPLIAEFPPIRLIGKPLGSYPRFLGSSPSGWTKAGVANLVDATG